MTNYSHLTNAELLKLLSLRDNLSDLELELLDRLRTLVEDAKQLPEGYAAIERHSAHRRAEA